MLTYRATRYRVYPTAEQERRLIAWQSALRWLWNLAHEQRLMGLARLNGEKVYVKYLQQQAELTELRAELPWLADVPVQCSQGLLRDLDKAWDKAFKKITRTPRWKSKRTAPPSLFTSAPSFTVSGEAVTFPKVGTIRAVIHRPLPGEPKTIQLVRDVDQWFAVVMCAIEAPEPAPHPGPAIGLDRGVANIVADSDGRIVENPRHADKAAARIARAQRNVARKVEQAKRDGRKPVGANITKARERVAKLQRKVRRQRDHLLQRESRGYAERNGLIVVEKLDVKAMSASAKGTTEKPGKRVKQKAGLNRGIVGAAWSKFAGLVKYKVDERGGKVVEVPAAYSSQTCHVCGHVAAENRPEQARFECVNCGLVEHADVNAAKVILARGLAGQVVAPKAPKKTLRVLKRARKAAVVPAVEACGGEALVKAPSEAGMPRREPMAPVCMSETSGPSP